MTSEWQLALVDLLDELGAELEVEGSGDLPVFVGGYSDGEFFRPLTDVSVYWWDDEKQEIVDNEKEGQRTHLRRCLVLWP